MRYIKHRIQEGERIDQISQKYYGNVTNIYDIFVINRDLKFQSDLSEYSGNEIYIPIKEDEDSEIIETVSPGIKGV